MPHLMTIDERKPSTELLEKETLSLLLSLSLSSPSLSGVRVQRGRHKEGLELPAIFLYKKRREVIGFGVSVHLRKVRLFAGEFVI